MKLTPFKAIRAKCLDCSAGSIKSVRLCPIFDCPLWMWRMGRRPETVRKKSPWMMDRDSVQRAINEDDED